jgi:transmembrane sensor
MSREMDSNEAPSVELIRRYFDGTLTEEDIRRLRMAYAETSQGASVLDVALAALRETPSSTDTTEARLDQARRLVGLVDGRGLARRTAPARPMHHAPSRRYLWIGGAALAAVALYFSLPNRATPPSARTYATHVGERTTVRLDDGSRITLAPNTKIVVTGGFGGAQRNVQLAAGQAYFDVASRPKSPFTVTSGRVTTRVLGTQFTVRRFAAERDVIVAVQTGKVATGRGTPVILTGDMLARITDSTTIVTPDANVRQYTEWTQGRLVFNDVVASEVTAVLGQWYGLTFRFADSTLIHRHLTGVFDDRDSRQDVLQNLKLVLGVRMQFDDNVVTLIPDASTKAPARRRSARDDRTWTSVESVEVGR